MSPVKTIVNITTAIVGVGELARYELTVRVGETICRKAWLVSAWDADLSLGLMAVGQWVNKELLDRLLCLKDRSVEVGHQNVSDHGKPLPDHLHEAIWGVVWDFFATNLLAGNL